MDINGTISRVKKVTSGKLIKGMATSWRWLQRFWVTMLALVLGVAIGVGVGGGAMLWQQVNREAIEPLLPSQTDEIKIVTGDSDAALQQAELAGNQAEAASKQPQVQGGVAELTAAPNLKLARLPLAGSPVKGFGFAYWPVFGDYRYHPGLDIAAPVNASVNSVLDGRVTGVDHSSAWAYRVTVEHGDGWSSIYGNLGQVVVKEGDTVKVGQLLGRVGQPGAAENNDGPHLHLEMRKNQSAQDPTNYLVGIQLAGDKS